MLTTIIGVILDAILGFVGRIIDKARDDAAVRAEVESARRAAEIMLEDRADADTADRLRRGDF